MYTVTFAGVEIDAVWDCDAWDLRHVPAPFRARVARLLDAEREREGREWAEDQGAFYGAARRYYA